jgi:subtilase family serine protease
MTLLEKNVPIIARGSTAALTVLSAIVGLTSAAMAQKYTTQSNTPGFIQKAKDLGPMNPSAVISVTAWLKLHNEDKLDKLVKSQNQKGSANYHKWITQAQFDANFGPSAQEVKALQNFLSAHGLSVIDVAANNAYVKVQGTVGAIEKAFHVQIDNFSFQGQTYRSNKADPSVNGPSGAHIAAITGMDDFGFDTNVVQASSPDGKPYSFVPLTKSSPNGLFFEGQCFRAPETETFTGGGNTATYTGNRYGSDITSGLGHLPPCGYAPSELQTAYNLTPLYQSGWDGAGETVVITDAYGSATIAQDAEAFSQIYGLPDLTPANFQIIKGKGLPNNPHGVQRNWEFETTLDVEWVHAMAPGAKIALVLATDRSSLDEAINLAVVQHLGNTISNSWGRIELFGNLATKIRTERTLQMAAAEGIDVNFATGDAGDFSTVIGIPAVLYPASSPFATGVGGTSLALNPDNTIAFQTGWGNNITEIADRISLGSTPVVPPFNEGFDGGSGGGTSVVFSKPSFQSGLPGNARLVPDISMLADSFTGVEIIETINGQLSVAVFGGTSLATPMFSGVMAIAAQKAGHGLGQAAALVYNLPPGAVDDIIDVTSPNNVTGVINGSTVETADDLAAPLGTTAGYYSALYNSPFSTRWFVLTFNTDTSLASVPGWDDVTGVGTPNGWNFVNAIAP